MSTSPENEAEYIAAVDAQNKAANPASTRLASANAGSGKTRVLVNRVSRILLAGAPPEKVLCLTYTKAAAAEMQSRLFETLGAWSILEDAPLRAALDELVGAPTPDIALTTARQLFAKALETPEGLKVQTIHAFCERILGRFPMEAGILPGYAPLDDLEMNAIREQIREQIYQEAMDAPQSALNKAVQRLTLAKADQTLDELFKWISYNSYEVEGWAEAGGCAPLAAALGLEDISIEIAGLKAKLWEAAPHEALRAAAKQMCDSPKAGDQENGRLLAEALTADNSVSAFDLYASFVFKKDELSVTSQICTAKSGPQALALFGAWNKTDTDEMARMAAAGQQIMGLKCYQLSEAFFILAQSFTAHFKAAKHAKRGLDFDDQIHLTRALLCRKEVSDWVRYKLDGGIEHILLDEAQDTSPAQWEIIDALSSAFIQDSPERGPHDTRTLFAVGDEKQSIYSFQGAEPKAFQDKIREYAGYDNKADIRMLMSFRSAPDILSFVDQIFIEDKARLKMFDSEDYAPAADLIRHSARRKDRGLVELWPALDKPESEAEKKPWDTTPVDALTQGDAREVLARQVAEKIKSWLDNKEPIFDRDKKSTRAMRAGDILILVQSRGPFFNAVIRNIKAVGVAVAGADRLKLKDAIVVKDLLALARFALLPQDDLALAELLKSPLIGWDETALFEAAHARNGSLYRAVRAGWPETGAFLDFVIKQATRFAPYEFFSKVLDYKGQSGARLHKQIYRRLGLEAKDALEAFLARALSHQRQGTPSLQHFVHSFASSEQELKREMDKAEEEGEGMVRVMTVHGAKGLEAPVVFLPDTTQIPTRAEPVITLSSGYALVGNAKQVPAVIEATKEQAKAKKRQEYLRLFYVAMTRAESRLIICGYKHGKNKGAVTKESWYAHAQKAFESLESTGFEMDDGTSVLRYGEVPQTIGAGAKVEAKPRLALPAWIDTPAAAPARPRKTVTPSHLLAAPDQSAHAMRSPLTQNKDRRFARGNLIHKLLEILPDVELEARADMADKILRSYKVLPKDHEQIKDEVMTVLNHPDFAELFAPGSRAEVSLAGATTSLGSGLYLNAQIDRLSVSETKVFIVDYKSNRPPPTRQEDVAEIYWGQMAAYRELAREIYPEREIICALLWTDGPSLMILDDKELSKALTRIKRLLT